MYSKGRSVHSRFRTQLGKCAPRGLGTCIWDRQMYSKGEILRPTVLKNRQVYSKGVRVLVPNCPFFRPFEK